VYHEDDDVEEEETSKILYTKYSFLPVISVKVSSSA
jgi:hypothetical protein